MDPLPSNQLNQEARLMARYDEGSAPSDATEEEAEGEAHGWLIARSALSSLPQADAITVMINDMLDTKLHPGGVR